MNAITPPKDIPPFHSTAANGRLPTLQTKDTTAISGPIRGPQMAETSGCEVKKNFWKNEVGTQAAMAPAISSPSATSVQTEAQSITKKWLVAVLPSGDRSFCSIGLLPLTDISSMAA